METNRFEDVARAVAQGFDRGVARGLREVAVEGGHDAAFAAGVADVFVREASFLRGGGAGGGGGRREGGLKTRGGESSVAARGSPPRVGETETERPRLKLRPRATESERNRTGWRRAREAQVLVGYIDPV